MGDPAKGFVSPKDFKTACHLMENGQAHQKDSWCEKWVTGADETYACGSEAELTW